ncbi:MAG: hypothetical protein RIT28_2559 [Pseudomonadota bacterium]
MSRAALLLMALGGCGAESPVDPAGDGLRAGGSLASCAEVAFAELAIPCRVGVAAEAGKAGDIALAEEACALVPDGLWREECHFRAGEELGKAGYTDRALRFCARAGDFARNCVTHAAWGLPPEPGLSPADPSRALAALDEQLNIYTAGLNGAAPGVQGEGVDILLSRAWFNLYVGSGSADPAAARGAEGEHGPHARTAWALEFVRLANLPPDQAVEAALAVWRGESPVPTGAALPPGPKVGRHTSPIVAEGVRAQRHAATFGGGVRLVGESVEEDLTVAVIEALFFNEGTLPPAFVAYQDDPRLTVRLTAWKLWGLTAPPEAVLAAITAATDPLIAETLRLAEGKNMQGPKAGRRRDAR